MYSDVKINMPDEILQKMQFEGNIFSTAKTDVIITGFSEQNGGDHILRIYQLSYNHFTNTHDFVQELEAFSFGTHKDLVDFFDKLPQLNGIEMLMLLNPISLNNTSFN
ncbi:MAG TPA: hypothetical protein VK121_04595 [Pseudogracilibacillus sp.]|nr:hypothetical protein [Pseudogracilibacillus sp.]